MSCACERPRLVAIESPYAGDVADNVAYAREALKDSLGRGECPLASHLLYTQVLDDADAVQRARGIAAGLAWAERADATVLYIDRGVSRGMKEALRRAREDGRAILEREMDEPQRVVAHAKTCNLAKEGAA